MTMGEKWRVQKYLSRAGVASRRKSEELMLEGRVSVNGQQCTELGTKVDIDSDTVEVDGNLVSLPSSHIYLLLNKPRGYITSLDDPHDRPIVTDLIPDKMPRVWPVGRLDWDSEGLLLLTDDGDLTHALTHPSYHVQKGYAVKVKGHLEPGSKEIEQLREGVQIDPGELTKPAQVAVRGKTEKNTWIEFVIEEGKNRQIRRMCEAVGLRIQRLRRIAQGTLTIEGVSPGDFRSLTSDEVLALYDEAGIEPSDFAKPSKRQLKREREARQRD
jgi:pseudouridine synthase